MKWPKPPTVDKIKIFDDDKAAKHSERKGMFCGVVITIKDFNLINSGRLWPPNSFFILHGLS